jgi:hypothetical protein
MRTPDPEEDVKLRELCLEVLLREADLARVKIPFDNAKVRLKAAIAKRDRHTRSLVEDHPLFDGREEEAAAGAPTDLEAVLTAESDADGDGEDQGQGQDQDQDQAEVDPPAVPLTNLRLPGPVTGKLIDAGLRTVADLKAPLEKKTGVLARKWGVTAAEVADVRRRFDDLAVVVSFGMGHILDKEVG